MSDVESDGACLPSDCQYVTGSLSSGQPVVAVLRETDRGWSVRSTHPHFFNHEYVSHQTLEEVLDWMRVRLRWTTVLQDRQEAVAHLTSLAETTDEDPHPKTGFLLGNPMAAPAAHAEAVCRHLEIGWRNEPRMQRA